MASTLDLLNLLASGLGTSDSISALSGKTSTTNDQATAALLSALPSMLGQMKTNASTQSGASSLMSALDQHDLSKLSNEDIVSLIKHADEDDGAKILDKIYGSKEKTEAATASVAKQSGIATAQMAKIMAIAAPALLTAVSAAKKKQAAQEASKKASESDELMALLSGLSGFDTGTLTGSGTGKKTLGKKTSSAKKDDGLDLGDILSMAGALSGSSSSKKTQSSGMDLGSLMNLAGGLMGGSSAKQRQSSSGMDGMASLLGTLLQGKKLF